MRDASGENDSGEESDRSRIRDIPFAQKLLDTSKQAAWLQSGASVLGWLGLIDTSDMPANLSELAERAEALAGLPDRFNAHYAERGWVAYESMNADVMSEATKRADEGEIEAGEAFLVEHYDAETIEFHLRRLRGIEEFAPRMEAARKALEDYEAGRYHASVPQVLMLTDGFVNDVRQTGFFAEGTDLTAWDSIAGHSTGLTKLAEIMTKSRMRTTGERITVPYRHGILHGRDLGYANEIVATKTWVALFAVRDWAISVKTGRPPEEEEEEDPLGFWDILEMHQETQEKKRKIEAWEPRDVRPGRDFPASGPPGNYPENTPERALAHFMEYWADENYGEMGRMLWWVVGKESYNARAGEAREQFSFGIPPAGFRIEAVRDKAASVAEVDLVAVFDVEGGGQEEREAAIRLTYIDENDDALIRGEDGGRWRVVEAGSDFPIVPREHQR